MIADSRLAEAVAGAKAGYSPPLTGYETNTDTLVKLWNMFDQSYSKAFLGDLPLGIVTGPDGRIHLLFEDQKCRGIAFTGAMIPPAYWKQAGFPLEWKSGKMRVKKGAWQDDKKTIKAHSIGCASIPATIKEVEKEVKEIYAQDELFKSADLNGKIAYVAEMYKKSPPELQAKLIQLTGLFGIKIHPITGEVSVTE